MQKIYFRLFLCCHLFVGIINAQQVKSMTYDALGFPCGFFGSNYDNGVFVCSGYRNTVNNAINYTMSRIDTNLNLLFCTSDSISLEDYATTNGIVKINNNKYLMTSVSRTGRISNILKFDSNGKLLKKSDFTSPSGTAIGLSKIHDINSRKYYTILNIVKESTAYYHSEIYLIDSTLSQIKKTSVSEEPRTFEANASYLMPNKNLVMFSGDNYLFSYSRKMDSTVWYLEVDTNLTVVKSKKYAKNLHEKIYDINYNAPNKTYLTVGSYFDTVVYDAGAGSFATFERAYLGCLDANFNILWERKIGISRQSPNSLLNRVKQLKDGNYLAVGTVMDTIITNNGKLDTVAYGVAIKFSPSGTILWTQRYLETVPCFVNENDFFDFEELESGNIILVGSITETYPTTERGGRSWTVKVNKNGSYITSGINLSRIGTSPKIYPNPSENGILKLEDLKSVDKIEMYNESGILINTIINVNDNLELDIQNINSRMIILNFYNKTGDLIYIHKQIR